MKMAMVVMMAVAATCSFAQNIYVAKSDDKTSKDLPFSYEAEKTYMDGDSVRLIGKVKNTGQSTYSYVKVTFTALKGYGTFMARDFVYTDPKDIGPGQVGYVDTRVDTDGVKPDNVKWVITGNPD